MSLKVTKFVDVILPLAVPNTYTYRIPFDWNQDIAVGKRVVVQFGKKKLYTSIVQTIHEKAPEHYAAKYIEGILDDHPIVHENNLAIWRWISEYYMCTIGEVMNAALPAGLKLVSQTKVVLLDENVDYSQLTAKESILVDALKIQEILEVSEIESILGIKTVYPTIKSLFEKRIIDLAEQVYEKYKPKFASFIQLKDDFCSEKEVNKVFDLLARAPKQSDAFMVFLQATKGDFSLKLSKSKFVKTNPALSVGIQALIKRGVLIEHKEEVNRIESYANDTNKSIQLSKEQNVAYQSIQEGFEANKPVLLHGITGSGKTEIYVQLIQDTLDKGGKVLYLLPEIALTTQIINRIRLFFGDRVGVYHSKFNANERVEIWNEVLKGDDSRYDIVIGARSAIFLPFKKIDLILVDEEHDASFKQYDPAPRYHARDTAIYIASKWKSKILLGSATPSIESYYNATQEKYHLVELFTRFGNIKLPEILCEDIQEATKRKKMKSHFSEFLLEHMQSYLANGEQIILFQNRRGYNPLWACEVCNWTPQCKNCDVSMTYHKHIHSLKCHYCGYQAKPYNSCQACGSNKLKMIGFGTEKVEEELGMFFPDKTIQRMDLDTTRLKNGYQNIISDFQEGLIDILVGTQMVTKGLDFDNVGMVGVLNADSLLHFPDFRSFERSFQQLTQVAGRAGRKEKRGKVVIQTYSPNHWVIQKVIQNDYQSLFKQELIERRNFKYPPFQRLIKITLKHKDKDIVQNAAQILANLLKVNLGERILGPDMPYISRVKNQFIYQIIVKFETDFNAKKLKSHIQEKVGLIHNKKMYARVIISFDVDFQ